MKIFSIMTFIAAGLAAVFLFGGVSGARGAPQEAAAGAVAAAMVVIPYAVTSILQRARIIHLLEMNQRSGRID